MKALITILIIAVVCLGAWKVWDYWSGLRGKNAEAPPPPQPVASEQLYGMAPQLEQSLQKAREGGPKALKRWLETYRKSTALRDPRLASVELDYALLVMHEDPVEAKRVFNDVKKRVPTDSPVYPRIKAMEPTFQ
jgi:hypothetical protein